ncbi:alanine dehydrogenase [Limnochorda pilosa]|uniref:Alanine dehydrogenase n=1 Tax=Limnochorda pilosa TaxID=1555112 RepID=A0A0K2SJM1_LIMPI|nr:alanine dehydrogenase [Limnochorda pilosa]BAS27290.1 alanine dehydrogenase [Limnochorda pilosa]
MVVGVPKEIKKDENRVALTPAGAAELVQAGHRVVVEQGAGAGSGMADEEYRAAGATLVPTHADVFAEADLIIKVKEPVEPEFNLFRPGQILFTYLHLAATEPVTRALLQRRVTGVAYETMQEPNGALPLLTPMSEVAGRMSVQVGAQFLEEIHGGRGVLLGGVPGVPPAEVVVLGAGTVGSNAARIALGMGAHVTIMDKRVDRLRYLEDVLTGNRITVVANQQTVDRAVRYADLVIGAVLVPGARAPRLVGEETVKGMKPGAVIVDVAVDQGGCIETVDHPTTHSDPVYVKHGVVHYAVANMPGAVPRTSTLALTNATLPYAVELARKGVRQAVAEDPVLAGGVNVIDGHVTHAAVAEAHDMEYVPLERVLAG